MLNFRTILNFTVILSFLIISLSIAYYLVIYLPNRTRKEDEARVLSERTKVQTEQIMQTALNDCLNEVSKRSTEAFSNTKNLKYEDIKILLGVFDSQKEECFKRYPQK